MRLIFPLVIVSLLLISCKKQLNTENPPIVKVGNDILYQQEVEKITASSISAEDSILMAEHYIRGWINNHLLYDVASRNIKSKNEIDALVENYKRSLIIYQYEEQLVNEKLTKNLDDASLRKFYDENGDKFKLDKSMIKGVYLKIPVEAPQIENVRSWYKFAKTSDIENIEKYSVQNASVYDNFMDKWVDFNEFIDNWPIDIPKEANVLKNRRFFEEKDSSFYYFLNVTEYLLPGDNAPFDETKQVIYDMVLNQRKIEFLKQTENDLYQRALNRGDIHFYKE